MFASAFSECPSLVEVKRAPGPGVLGLHHHRTETRIWVQELSLGCDSKKQE